MYLKFTRCIFTLTPQLTHTALMYVTIDLNFEVQLKVFAPTRHISLAMSLLDTCGRSPLGEQPLQIQKDAKRVEQYAL